MSSEEEEEEEIELRRLGSLICFSCSGFGGELNVFCGMGYMYYSSTN